MFAVQTGISMFVLIFCSAMLAKHEDPTVYLPVITSIMGYWIPAPKYAAASLPNLFMQHRKKKSTASTSCPSPNTIVTPSRRPSTDDQGPAMTQAPSTTSSIEITVHSTTDEDETQPTTTPAAA